jgi:hypothetical protein
VEPAAGRGEEGALDQFAFLLLAHDGLAFRSTVAEIDPRAHRMDVGRRGVEMTLRSDRSARR